MPKASRYSGDWWRELRADLDTRFTASKNSQDAISRLAEEYGLVPVERRQEMDDVLAEWLLSDDEGLRFDALYIVREYQVRSAEPALRSLQDSLEGATDPSAPYEWAKVNQVIGKLAESN